MKEASAEERGASTYPGTMVAQNLIHGGVEILLVVYATETGDKRRPDRLDLRLNVIDDFLLLLQFQV